MPTTSTSATRDDDDQEVEYKGHTGELALIDYPHGRENCATHPFVIGKKDLCEKHCPNCYCYVW